MNLLLDTHVFLWFLSDDRRMPAAFLAAIEDPGSRVALSVVSVWEAVIKHGTGKLPLQEPPEILLPREREANAIESLAIDEGAMPFLADLPPIHRDPFDRLLVAQAQQHDLTLLTVDPAVLAYDTKNLPA